MQIGKLAKAGGVKVETIRFYERNGLLRKPARKESGYRVYQPEDLHQLQFIRQAKALGFSLDEIRDVLRMRERGQCPCVDVIAMAECHLQEIQRQMSDLAKFRRELAGALRKWKQSGEKKLSADAFCVLIERTMATSGRKRGYR